MSRSRLRGGLLHSWFGDRLLHKSLWRPTPEALARAWLVGFPITVIPFLPGQSVFACIAALLVRGNVMLCIALQFLSTPFTAPLQIGACYLVGELVRGHDVSAVWHHVVASPGDFVSGTAAASIYIGAVVIGILGGAGGYAVIQRIGHPTPRKRSPHVATARVLKPAETARRPLERV